LSRISIMSTIKNKSHNKTYEVAASLDVPVK